MLVFCAVHCVKRARHHRWKWARVTFWSADEQLCQLWLQTLRELLENLSTWASFRICCQAAQLWWHAGLSGLTQVDVMDPFALFPCFLLRGSQWSSRSVWTPQLQCWPSPCLGAVRLEQIPQAPKPRYLSL